MERTKRTRTNLQPSPSQVLQKGCVHPELIEQIRPGCQATTPRTTRELQSWDLPRPSTTATAQPSARMRIQQLRRPRTSAAASTTELQRYIARPPPDQFSATKLAHGAAVNVGEPGSPTITLKLDPAKPDSYLNRTCILALVLL